MWNATGAGSDESFYHATANIRSSNTNTPTARPPNARTRVSNHHQLEKKVVIAFLGCHLLGCLPWTDYKTPPEHKHPRLNATGHYWFMQLWHTPPTTQGNHHNTGDNYAAKTQQ